MALRIPYIASDVYELGIKNTITEPASGRNLVIALLDNNDRILAVSALMSASGNSVGGDNESGATTFKPENAASGQNGFVYDSLTKKLTIPVVPYTATKSIIDVAAIAYRFAVLSVTSNHIADPDAAFEGSKFFNYPTVATNTTLSSSITEDFYPLIVGSLSGNPTVNANSNFRLTSTNITFNETAA